MAAGLAVTAAALAASTARGADVAGGPGHQTQGGPGTGVPAAASPAREPRPATEFVSAPVRIADAATVRLLRPGDRVDVIAAADPPAAGSEGAVAAKVVASGVRVTEVPAGSEDSGDGGALVVLSVPRATAAELAGAGATSRLVVTVC
jgi:hypothetical protein